MRIDQVISKMIDEGKRFMRDAWYDERRDDRGEDPDYLFWQKGYPQGIPVNAQTAQAVGLPEGTTCYFSPYLMRHFGGNSFAPYQLTTEDIYATDWEPFVRATNDVGVGYNFENPQPAIHVNRCRDDDCQH